MCEHIRKSAKLSAHVAMGVFVQAMKKEKHQQNHILCLRVKKIFSIIAALTVDSNASVLATKKSFSANSTVSVIFPQVF